MLKPKGYPSYRKQVSVREGAIHMARWKLRGCPRCDGDMFADRDLHGLSEQCLQCGYARYLTKTVQSNQRAHNKKEEERMVITPSEEW